MTLTVFAGFIFAEFAGYGLHRLMHSEKIEFLSRNHMIHHLIVYGPTQPMRPSRDYLNSTYDRANILGLGLEWIFPVAMILVLALGGMRLFHVGAITQTVFIGAALAWGYAMFWYMHDAMHLKGFWMGASPLLAPWFLQARKRHDIHHMRLDVWGRMPANFGICFFLFDRIFGTLATEHGRFNRLGLESAIRRYAYIFPSGRRLCQAPATTALEQPDEDAQEYLDLGVGD